MIFVSGEMYTSSTYYRILGRVHTKMKSKATNEERQRMVDEVNVTCSIISIMLHVIGDDRMASCSH